MVGVEVYIPYLRFCKEHKIYDDMIRADVRFPPFRDNSVDTIIASEVIEHLNKKDGLKFLSKIEIIVRKEIVLTTPNGFWHQDAIHGAESEIHRSAWSVKDFRKRGYKVRGLGFKYAWHLANNPILWNLLNYLFMPISFILPWIGVSIIATYKKS
jgi:hypothetical protein